MLSEITMKKNYWIMGLLVILGLITQISSVWAIETAEIPQQPFCGSAEIVINEIDYDQPGTDQTEFVELRGDAGTSLDNFELHLLANNGTIYRNFSLQGKSFSTMGYFLVNGDFVRSASQLSNENQLTVTQIDFIVNDTPGAVAIFDTASNLYCSAINYGGTTPGLEAWLNIGIDHEADGTNRGCNRTSSTWWACDRPITPGGSNGTVAVALRPHSSRQPTMSWVFIAIATLSWQTFILVRRKREVDKACCACAKSSL